MARHKDVDWKLPDPVETWAQAQIAVLMDIRDELRRISAVLHCSNFLSLPRQVELIRHNTTRRKKKPSPK